MAESAILKSASVERPDIERTPVDISEIGDISRPIGLVEAIFPLPPSGEGSCC